MIYRRFKTDEIDDLWALQTAYKAEIGEDEPSSDDRKRLLAAMEDGTIAFFGAREDGKAVGCCSITAGFSTFNYAKSGVLEDLYIVPSYRHNGIARNLIRYSLSESGVGSLTVGCADCDLNMYEALGFTVRLGNLPAFELQ